MHRSNINALVSLLRQITQTDESSIKLRVRDFDANFVTEVEHATQHYYIKVYQRCWQ